MSPEHYALAIILWVALNAALVAAITAGRSFAYRHRTRRRLRALR